MRISKIEHKVNQWVILSNTVKIVKILTQLRNLG